MEELQSILTERISRGYIDRWNKVTVCTWEDAPEWVRDAYAENTDHFYIVWNGSKSKTNHHDYEIKEIPNKDLEIVLQRNKNRLNNQTKTYK